MKLAKATTHLILAITFGTWCTGSTVLLGAGPARKIDFSRDVRPLLSRHCFQCHGPDEQARQGDLRLDERANAVAELPSGGRAIVPGDPAASSLIDRITTTDTSRSMPPREISKPLAPAEIEILQRWIEQNADYARHWAYISPIRPPLPDSALSDVEHNPPRNEIDQFIFAKLKEEGLKPAMPAEAAALLRRVSLDLTGLPPTLEEDQPVFGRGSS